MSKRSILLMLDPDEQSSVFDRVVAVDAGAEVIFAHGGVKPEQVPGLVHGCIFTRSPKDLAKTAIFVGGSNVEASEAILTQVRSAMIPSYGLQVSTMMDANGCNTTAAAAVRKASTHLPLKGEKALVLGGTGPVGSRVALLLAKEGMEVRLGSRSISKAEPIALSISKRVGASCSSVEPVELSSEQSILGAAGGCTLVIACGAAGARFTSVEKLAGISGLRVAIDLNGVPPLGLEGVQPSDAAKERSGILCYGALGVGGFKIKLHRASIASLFEKNCLNLEAAEIYDLAKSLEA
jgi:hypothetical protein